ncbi:hypothetical protein JX266_003849 [Neoarthrinium moseri]|nr:hypothetical protein JX266_003849 [Neoarthrinium moseri]
MSAMRLYAARPLSGIWASHAGRPALAPASRFCRANTRSPSLDRLAETIVLARFQQRRLQSTSGGSKRPPEFSQPPKPSLKLLFQALRQSWSLRPLVGAFRGQSFRKLYRQSPEELVIAIVLLSGISVIVVYVAYTYFNYFQAEQFTRFPPDVAKSMRRALYYSNYSLDPKLALKYYKMALEQCDRNGIDPFSDGVLGIKIQLAAWLEKLGSYQNSIDVLEVLLRDCQTWVDKMEQTARSGLIDKAGNLIEAPKPPQKKEESSDAEEEVPENLWAKRTRVLGKMVGISVKLGELYADEHVLKSDAAGERLVWAVETVLKELQRRQTEGVKEGEGDWMSPEQIGGALEALANHYESKSQHYLAAPLYLQALTLSPPKSCHTAVLMNNLAISLAQQPVAVPGGMGVADSKDQVQPTRASLLASARSWALQAHATGSKVTGDDRTEECDEACAVALCNLGEIAAMSGDMEEAKSKFKQSLSLSRRIGFAPGVTQAEDGLAAASIKIPPRSS